MQSFPSVADHHLLPFTDVGDFGLSTYLPFAAASNLVCTRCSLVPSLIVYLVLLLMFHFMVLNFQHTNFDHYSTKSCNLLLHLHILTSFSFFLSFDNPQKHASKVYLVVYGGFLYNIISMYDLIWKRNPKWLHLLYAKWKVAGRRFWALLILCIMILSTSSLVFLIILLFSDIMLMLNSLVSVLLEAAICMEHLNSVLTVKNVKLNHVIKMHT